MIRRVPAPFFPQAGLTAGPSRRPTLGSVPRFASRRSAVLAFLLGIAALHPAAPACVAQQPTQQPRVEYEVSFPNPGTHEAKVILSFHGLPVGRPLEVRMSRASPGRYAEHDFAKNVYSVAAIDGRGRALELRRPSPHAWTVAGHDGTVQIAYVVWGDRVDGTYLAVDHGHAHMNMPATFMWAVGLEEVPIRLTVYPQHGWRVVTQLPTGGALDVFTAPNLQYFLDSPTEVGPVELRTWPEAYGGRNATYRLSVHHTGAPEQVDSMVPLIRAMVAEQFAVWGEMPAYDFGEYTFILDQLPWARGDGMEHRNSTIVSGNAPIGTRAERIARLGTVSHEHFHAWNVERLRPRSLEPFDFTRANMSGELWLAEGFTSYYGPLTIRRAGIYTDEEYLRILSNSLLTVIESPARAYGSPVDMSRRAPFVDAATSIDPTHHHNTFLSYYTWGTAVGAGLDLTLRTRFNLTLDDWMQALWRDFGRHQTDALAPARPYTLADLRASLGALTRDTAFAGDFFRRYIEGSEVPDYAQLLAAAGFLLAADTTLPYLGGSFDDDTAGVFVNWTAADGPLFQRGVNNGDLITAVDGRRFITPDSLTAYVESLAIGREVRLEIVGRSGPRTEDIVLPGRPRLRIVTFERAGRTVTPEIRAFREAWLGSRARR